MTDHHAARGPRVVEVADAAVVCNHPHSRLVAHSIRLFTFRVAICAPPHPPPTFGKGEGGGWFFCCCCCCHPASRSGRWWKTSQLLPPCPPSLIIFHLPMINRPTRPPHHPPAARFPISLWCAKEKNKVFDFFFFFKYFF